MRYKLTIAYRGTHYHGWQSQMMNQTWKGRIPRPGHGIPTIQETLQRAIEMVVDHDVELVGSSRTDSGVHAKRQIAHFATDKTQIPADSLRISINHKLPDDIWIRSVEAVPDDFDAILSTTSKRYQYVIWYSTERPVMIGDLVWHRWKPLDIDAMQQAAGYLVGTHDFKSFTKPGHKREHTIRTVLSCSLSYRAPRLVLGIEAQGFLWHMVRIIVGTLVDVGMGKFAPQEIIDMLAAKDRRSAGTTAPPCGLYLQWIKTRGNAE
jgi:tRNA pseudouridine38-40 synthase